MKNVEVLLREHVKEGETHLGRMHALWTLEGMDALDWRTTTAALEDGHAHVRATALRVLERIITPERQEELLDAILLQSEVLQVCPVVRFPAPLSSTQWPADDRYQRRYKQGGYDEAAYRKECGHHRSGVGRREGRPCSSHFVRNRKS